MGQLGRPITWLSNHVKPWSDCQPMPNHCMTVKPCQPIVWLSNHVQPLPEYQTMSNHCLVVKPCQTIIWLSNHVKPLPVVKPCQTITCCQTMSNHRLVVKPCQTIGWPDWPTEPTKIKINIYKWWFRRFISHIAYRVHCKLVCFPTKSECPSKVKKHPSKVKKDPSKVKKDPSKVKFFSIKWSATCGHFCLPRPINKHWGKCVHKWQFFSIK